MKFDCLSHTSNNTRMKRSRKRKKDRERERKREGKKKAIKRKKKRNDCPLHSIIECNRKNKAHEPSKETEKRKTDTDRNKSRQ
jgi:hypothetical protein